LLLPLVAFAFSFRCIRFFFGCKLNFPLVPRTSP
jgi:hypothetical protein